ncbi:hypothetical protein TR74_08635 [Carbonactinospora thermoautotrophica]|uniref:Uncharacterized protein n=1 Tax=Carbonactinospora thermoautotrophica TaxID=1469144 RepID=A0A132NHP2_9ACTN|nr:hypothetical protein TR74_08635 [Carbonactinospora thermoautotrophica]
MLKNECIRSQAMSNSTQQTQERTTGVDTAITQQPTPPPVSIRLVPGGTPLPMWTPARVPAPCGGEG